jgi:hypothetical protein
MVRGSTQDTTIVWPPTTKRAYVAAGATQLGLGDKGYSGLDLGWISSRTSHSPPWGTA